MGKSRRNKKPFDPISIFIEKSSQNDFKWVPNPSRKVDSKQEPVGFFHVYQFKCSCKDPWYCEWESADIYATKGEPCENPDCENKPPVMPSNKDPILSPTPCYSAEGYFFGMFQCPNPSCKNSWHSSLAFAATYQACSRCHTWAYSFNMTDEPLFAIGGTGSHDKDNCQKCKDLGFPCYREKRGRKSKKGRGNWNRYFLDPADGCKPKNNNKNRKKKQNSSTNNHKGDGGGPPSAPALKINTKIVPATKPSVASVAPNAAASPIAPAVRSPGQPRDKVTKKKKKDNNVNTNNGGGGGPGGGGPPSAPALKIKTKIVPAPNSSASSPVPNAAAASLVAPTTKSPGHPAVEVAAKKKRNRRGKKTTDGAAQVKIVSPPREYEGKMVKIVQDLSKMSFPNKTNNDTNKAKKAPKIE